MKKVSATALTDFINSRNPREKIMFVFLFIAAVFAIDYILLVQPIVNLFMNELPLQKSLKAELVELKEDQKNKENIQKNYVELKTRFEEILATFIENDQVPELLENLSKIASDAGVRIVTIKPSPESTVDSIPGFSLLPIEMTASSGTHALGNFLYRLESDKMFYRVEGLSIQANPAEPGKHQITVRLETYRKTANAKA